MRKLITSIGAGAAAVALFLSVGSTPANAYGNGTWTATPSGCNTGVFSGESRWSSNLARAFTQEGNNFCWVGNVKVAVAIHDQWATEKGPWVIAANWAYSSYSTPYISGWGGWHNWGDSGGRTT